MICINQRAKTKQTVSANKQRYQWAQFISEFLRYVYLEKNVHCKVSRNLIPKYPL